MADKDQHSSHSHGKGSGQENIDGVDIVNTTSQRMGESYRKSDIEELYKKAHPTSWQDLLNFVDKKGDATWHITPGEAVAIKKDIQRVMGSNKPFPNNPDQAFQELSSQGMGGKAHPHSEQHEQQHQHGHH